jgi:CRISPR-associated protein Csh2
MSPIVENRSEILFLYDATYANPNGDPMEENRPRIDEETGTNIVTDVRLKRTIRDYFLDLIESNDSRLSNQDVFIRETRDDEGYLYDAKRRAKDFLEKEEGKFSEMKEATQRDICSKCIDIRLFGAVIPLEFKTEENKTETGSITLTGPVQFRFGRSLHRVSTKFIKGTGAFASDYEKKKSMQYTFREEYILPYSLITFYGVVNENAARSTGLTEEDVNMLLEGVWNGTKNLITRSKFGQMPRFLMKITYREKNFHIGDLDKMIICIPGDGMEDEKIRNISELKLDASTLMRSLSEFKGRIQRIDFKVSSELLFAVDGTTIKGDDLVGKMKEILGSQIPINRLNF